MSDEEIQNDSNEPDESLSDDASSSRGLRIALILATVAVFSGGIFLTFHRGQQLKQKLNDRHSSAEVSTETRPVDPPPPEAYPWLAGYDAANSIAARIPPPKGFVRVAVHSDSFAHWLRCLPLKVGQQPVRLHDGTLKKNQDAHFAVIDIDTGPKDLQQCADAVIRLRAEYLFARNDFSAIRFHLTSDDVFGWLDWRAGKRPVVKGDKVTYRTVATKLDDSHANFRKYLDTVFAYAGTISLAKDLTPVPSARDMRIGAVFLHPASPGHAVIIVDMVEHPKTLDRGFLLAQSFMPAQDMHILVNPADGSSGPWYPAAFGPQLRTPEWTFPAEELYRFK